MTNDKVETQSILLEWRNERARRIMSSVSVPGVFFAVLATVADIIYHMPGVVLAGDLGLLVGCFVTFYISKIKKCKSPWAWTPIYSGVWISILTSLASTGGLHSPFVGSYLALIFVTGMVVQAKIKPSWIFLFTMLNLAFWAVMEFVVPGSLGESPPTMFNLVIHVVVLLILMICTYEFLKTEKALAEEILQRFKELQEARETVAREEEANASKTAFLANISHELRTPLGAILGYAELIQDGNLHEAEKNSFAETIRRNGLQLSRLVDDLLDLSKVEAGKIELENIGFRPQQLIAETVDLLALQARKKGLEIHLEFQAQVPDLMFSDPLRVKQILTNLIGNAIKFTDRGLINISVKGHEKKRLLTIAIIDSGRGLTPDEQTRLFRPFTQADPSVTRKFGGTGLGLSLSKRLAQILGGDLRLKWSQPGVGSSFELILPNRSVRTGRESIPATPESKPYSSATKAVFDVLIAKKVLVVDDTVDNQRLISRHLEKWGLGVEVASDGLEGIQKATHSNFDLVIMDIQMPVLDGIQATTMLRQKCYDKPIIALTAHAMKEDRDRCLAAGFDDYLTKPIDRNMLMRKITEVLSKDLSLLKKEHLTSLES